MLALLDKRCASTRAVTLMSVLTYIYFKRHCKLSDQVKKYMRAISEASKKKDKKLHFGSSGIPQKQCNSSALSCNEVTPKVVNSGASTTFFKSEGEVLEGTYTAG